MINPWFKFYGGEYLSDPKIASLSAQQRSCWITLLALAGSSSTPGVVEYLSVEVLLEKSGIVFDPYDSNEWDRCISVLDIFVRMKMISKSDDGLIKILNWDKRQETNLTDAERSKSYRDRKKKRHENVTGSVTNVTQEENRREEIYTESNDSEPIKIVEGTERVVKEKTGGGTKQYEELCRWLEKTTGVKIINRAKQYKHLAKAKTANISPTRLKQRATELLSEPWYVEHGLDWGGVVSSFDRKA